MPEVDVRVIPRARRDEIRISARRVSIVHGQTARDKVVRVEGLTAAELRASMMSGG
jgi:uncharacterized protein YggU (UPF0235/DUF167 family)